MIWRQNFFNWLEEKTSKSNNIVFLSCSGVTHGDDLIYLFSTGLFTFTDEDTKVRKQMVELWTNFAIYG